MGPLEFEIIGRVKDTGTGVQKVWDGFGEGDCSLESAIAAEKDFEELMTEFKARRRKRLADKMKLDK